MYKKNDHIFHKILNKMGSKDLPDLPKKYCNCPSTYFRIYCSYPVDFHSPRWTVIENFYEENYQEYVTTIMFPIPFTLLSAHSLIQGVYPQYWVGITNERKRYKLSELFKTESESSFIAI